MLVKIQSKFWGPTVVALCVPCWRVLSLAHIRVLFLLRSQVANLYNRVAATEASVQNLFAAQQQMETVMFSSE